MLSDQPPESSEMAHVGALQRDLDVERHLIGHAEDALRFERVERQRLEQALVELDREHGAQMESQQEAHLKAVEGTTTSTLKRSIGWIKCTTRRSSSDLALYWTSTPSYPRS